MKKLAILSTHPIQYNAPLFRRMAEQADWNVHVFFSRTLKQVSYDPDFQREVVWDTPLTEGYAHSHLDAAAFSGVDALIQGIEAFQPTALLVYGWNFPGHRQVMRAFHGRIPIGFRGDSHLLNPMPIYWRWIRKAVLRRVYRHVDLAFSVGTANTAYFRWSGIPKANIAVAPHAVDNAFWQKDDAERQQAAGQWKANGHSETAPSRFCRAEPLKQVGRVIKAFKQVSSSSSGHRRNCRMKPRFATKLQCIPASTSWALSTRAAAVFLSHAVGSPFPRPAKRGACPNEALACGTRCMVSDRVGCGTDLFRDPNLGAIVAWDQPTEWAPVLDTMLDHPYLEDQSLDAFVKTYSYQAMMDALPKLWSR